MWYGSYSGSDSGDDEFGETKEHLAAWKEQATKLKSTQQSVYILTLETWGHEDWGRGPDEEFIGVFDSKAAAVAKSVTVDTMYGTFDEAIKEMFPDDAHEDNRKNPPDNGILVQIGGDGIGYGDYARLVMKKKVVVGLSRDEPNNRKKRTPATMGQNGSNKKQRCDVIEKIENEKRWTGAS